MGWALVVAGVLTILGGMLVNVFAHSVPASMLLIVIGLLLSGTGSMLLQRNNRRH